MSQSGRYSLQPGGAIVTIDGDLGSVTGSTIAFNALNYAGSTTTFVGTGTVMTFDITDGNSNIILGAGSGNLTLSGSNNVALGSLSVPALTTASRCFMGGTGAGNTLTTATDCVGIGDYVFGFGALSPSKSIGIGTAALEDCNGSYNIGIGYEAGTSYSGTESSNILLNNSGTVGESNVLRIGAATGTGNGELANAYICGINGVDVGSVASVVSINGNHLGSTTLTAGSNITITPGANTITIAAAGGVTSITGDTGSTLTGAITINANTHSGSSVFFSGTGSTLSLKVTDANDNTLIGSTAGNGSLTGTENAGVGDGVFHSLTSGANNTALGHQALYNITSSNHNDAFGSATLYHLTTGTQNAGFGEATLSNITTGANNVAVGYTAGSSYTTSESSNISIGSLTTGTVGESNVLRIGNGTGTSAGNLNKAFISGINGITATGADQVLVINSSNQIGALAAGTTGQILTSNGAAALPTWQNAAVAFTWSVITADQTAVVNNGYICNKASALVLTLPATSTVGTLLEVTGMNTALGWKIAQNGGQQIFFGTSSTTIGATGYLQSSNIYDAVRLVCNVANTSWIVISSIGNITVV